MKHSYGYEEIVPERGKGQNLEGLKLLHLNSGQHKSSAELQKARCHSKGVPKLLGDSWGAALQLPRTSDKVPRPSHGISKLEQEQMSNINLSGKMC